MNRQMMRLGLSLMLGIGWWTAKLPAQPPSLPPAVVMPPAVVEQAVPAPPGHFAPAVPPQRPWTRVVSDHGCYATHNSVGCSSLRAELTFIFGSCRTFFGEPCAPSPPHPWQLRR